MEYEIINSYTIRALEDMVTARLKNGWQCQGGVVVERVVNGPYMHQFFQAMINTSTTL